MASASYHTKFIEKIQRTQNVFSFYFEKPAGFTYIAGQYNNWKIPHPNPDERGDTRYFTICSAPWEKNLMFTTKIGQSSFKQNLLKLKPGHDLEFEGPLGKFTLSDPSRHHVFLAGGIGITPYRSMIAEAAHQGWSAPITLLVSWSTVEDVVFHDELQDTATKNTFFTLKETVTHPEESKQSWTGLTGRIDKEMLLASITDMSSCIFYLCGPPAMVEALKTIMSEMNVSPEQIKIEKFSGY